MSFESLLSYVFFISILSSISLYPASSPPDTSLQTYRLLGDVSIILQKSGAIGDFANNINSASLDAKLDEITSQTGYCLTLSLQSTFTSVSNCACPSQEKFSEEIFTPSPPFRKIQISLQKEQCQSV
ncbi:hypothetical protein COV61_00895 [Candidatus Micrarchaeota archaeon CG11_big_fil_rev_8_21_14_0_20_47_5]|nr:MAG: hypothetical protein AUJ17_03555 [Candidatus Micrarchaeota archaeon CG1_02_47_40]PIN84181.1 MAG: hypothetical protein COV61_00895 [Candidatus Micrarchaeota archaeon CG11_big_fil_rev_8_21_14_0_20_47_5]